MFLEIVLHFDSGHASARCRGDGLPVFLVRYIAGREDSLYIRRSVDGSVFRDDIAFLVGSDLSFEEVRIRFVSYGIE